MTDAREGVYYDWEWDSMRKCWAASIPLRIYPHEDGTFSVSTHSVWHEGAFPTFEAAEQEAINGPSEAAIMAHTASLEGRIAELEEGLREFADFVRGAPVSSGMCCCGDDIATHAEPMSCGHSPVDQWDWSLKLHLDSVEALLRPSPPREG